MNVRNVYSFKDLGHLSRLSQSTQLQQMSQRNPNLIAYSSLVFGICFAQLLCCPFHLLIP